MATTSKDNYVVLFEGDFIFHPDTPKSILDFVEEYPSYKDGDDECFIVTKMFSDFKKTGKSLGCNDFVKAVRRDFGLTRSDSDDELRELWAKNEAVKAFVIRDGYDKAIVDRAFPIERLFMVAY